MERTQMFWHIQLSDFYLNLKLHNDFSIIWSFMYIYSICHCKVFFGTFIDFNWKIMDPAILIYFQNTFDYKKNQYCYIEYYTNTKYRKISFLENYTKGTV